MKKTLLFLAVLAMATTVSAQKVTSSTYPFKQDRTFKMVLHVDDTTAAKNAIEHYIKTSKFSKKGGENESYVGFSMKSDGHEGIFQVSELTRAEREELERTVAKNIAYIEAALANPDPEEGDENKEILEAELESLKNIAYPMYNSCLFMPAAHIKQFGFPAVFHAFKLFADVYVSCDMDSNVIVTFTNFDAHILQMVSDHGRLEYIDKEKKTETDKLIERDWLSGDQVTAENIERWYNDPNNAEAVKELNISRETLKSLVGMRAWEKLALYERGVAGGHWDWVSYSNVFRYLRYSAFKQDHEYMDPVWKSGWKTSVKIEKANIANNVVRHLTPTGWNTVYQTFYEEFFKMLRDEAGGVVKSIEIDDVPIYTFDDESNTTLPVDKKERKKWLKEKKSF